MEAIQTIPEWKAAVDEIWALFKESDRKMQETRKQMKENAREMRESSKRLDKQLGERATVSAKWLNIWSCRIC